MTPARKVTSNSLHKVRTGNIKKITTMDDSVKLYVRSKPISWDRNAKMRSKKLSSHAAERRSVCVTSKGTRTPTWRQQSHRKT